MVFFLNTFFSFSQQKIKKDHTTHTIDSLNQRIGFIQNQISEIGDNRSLNYLNLKRELDHTVFVKAYEEYIIDENLYKAQSMVEEHLERAEFRRDENSIDFYKNYRTRINDEIKMRKVRYQKLFTKESYYKNELNIYLKEKTLPSLERADRLNDMAIKYAKENNLLETLVYLEKYRKQIDGLIFDYNSSFDLQDLTNNEKAFNKQFLLLVKSDSLTKIKLAETLVNECLFYTKTVSSSLDTIFFNKKKNYVATAISDYYDKLGARMEMEKLTDQAVTARLDTINPVGVYKWHGKVLVINEFIPKYGSHNLRKGEAIIESDKKLMKYIKDQDVVKLKDYDIGGTYFVRYKTSNSAEDFCYNFETKKWQYMLCYEVIGSELLTREVSKYMPPIVFREEEMGIK